jgi:hypothetical protein
MSSSEGGQVTGTQDKDYNLIWFTELGVPSGRLRRLQQASTAPVVTR